MVICVLIADCEGSFCERVRDKLVEEYPGKLRILVATTLEAFERLAPSMNIVVVGPCLDAGKAATYDAVRNLRARGFTGALIACSCAHNKHLLAAGCSHAAGGYWELLGVLQELLKHEP